MGRMGCCEKVGLKKGPWTPEEDKKLLSYIGKYGQGNWRLVPAKAGLQRCGKSCRLRWINYLKPDIKRGNFTMEEDHIIIQLHALFGNKWSIIAAHLPGRTDNEIKNYWNTNIKKRLIRAGIDPITHNAINSNTFQAYGGGHDQSEVTIDKGHVTQLESAQLEAEATGSMMQVGCSSSHIPRLFLSKIPTQPCPSLDLSSSNHKTVYNMYALVLATNHDLQSLVSTSTLSVHKLPTVTTNIRQYTNKESSLLCKGNDNVESSNEIQNVVGDYYVSNLQDDDITVAVEAFRKTSSQSIQELFNESSESIA